MSICILFHYKSNNYSDDDEEKALPFVSGIGFNQFLKNQLATFSLNNDDQKIAEFLIGSVDQSGYIRSELLDIVDDFFYKYDTNQDDKITLTELLNSGNIPKPNLQLTCT